MSDDYVIYYQDLSDRLAKIPDLDNFGVEHGMQDIRNAFKVNQIFPPNPGQEVFRSILRDLGYDFGIDQTVRIST